MGEFEGEGDFFTLEKVPVPLNTYFRFFRQKAVHQLVQTFPGRAAAELEAQGLDAGQAAHIAGHHAAHLPEGGATGTEFLGQFHVAQDHGPQGGR